jgi:hypothetical protein
MLQNRILHKPQRKLSHLWLCNLLHLIQKIMIS